MANPIVKHMEVYPGLTFAQFSIDELEKAAEELETQADTTDLQSLRYVYSRIAETIRTCISRRKREINEITNKVRERQQREM